MVSKCLSLPKGLGCSPLDGKAVHPHDDGTWWFWTETWCDEEGPYQSQQEAEDACVRYTKEVLGA